MTMEQEMDALQKEVKTLLDEEAAMAKNAAATSAEKMALIDKINTLIDKINAWIKGPEIMGKETWEEIGEKIGAMINELQANMLKAMGTESEINIRAIEDSLVTAGRCRIMEAFCQLLTNARNRLQRSM